MQIVLSMVPIGSWGGFSSIPKSWTEALVCGFVAAQKKRSILLVCVYLFVEDGLGAKNLALLTQLSLLFQLVAAPVIVFGDFNLDEGQLAAWRETNELVACRPDSQPTTSLRSGRSIDHVFVSSGFASLVRPVGLEACAWRPHLALRVEFSRRPCLL